MPAGARRRPAQGAAPDPGEHLAVVARAGRGPQEDDLGVPLGAGGVRRPEGLERVVAQLLGLVHDDDVHGEAAPRPLGAGDELDRAAVVQEYRLLPVGAADVGDHVRELGVVAAVVEIAQEPPEGLPGGLDLVGGVQEPLADHGHAVDLAALQGAVLAVLARHGQSAAGVDPRPVRSGGEPVVQNQRLPVVQGHAVGGHEPVGVDPVIEGAGAVGHSQARDLRADHGGGGRARQLGSPSSSPAHPPPRRRRSPS